jgi:hypothetical protein
MQKKSKRQEQVNDRIGKGALYLSSQQKTASALHQFLCQAQEI